MRARRNYHAGHPQSNWRQASPAENYGAEGSRMVELYGGVGEAPRSNA